MACPMSMHRLPELGDAPMSNHASIYSLGVVTALFATAYSSCFILLRKSSTTKVRIFFIWHFFDALIHLIIGAFYLCNVFFTYMSTLEIAYTRGMYSQPMTPAGVYFLGDSSHLYGSFYGTSAAAKLWQDYAKADKRWGGSDLTIISVELLKFFVMAPLALYICQLLREQKHAKASFWMVLVATGELYGGFMIFSPEWLSGSTNLDTSHFQTLWFYLVSFNSLWVFFPFWVLWDAYRALTCPVEVLNPRAWSGGMKEAVEIISNAS